MGYRSTLITNEFYEEIPQWFVDKWKDQYVFGYKDGKPAACIAGVYERKYYSMENEEIFTDIAKIQGEMDISWCIDGALVHEDGEITRFEIDSDHIKIDHLETGGYNSQLGDSTIKVLDNQDKVE